MKTNGPTGRIRTAETVQREMRRALNAHAQQISEKLLAKALSGDAQCLATAASLLTQINKPEPTKP